MLGAASRSRPAGRLRACALAASLSLAAAGGALLTQSPPPPPAHAAGAPLPPPRPPSPPPHPLPPSPPAPVVTSTDAETGLLCFASQAVCEGPSSPNDCTPTGRRCRFDGAASGNVSAPGACAHLQTAATRWYCPDDTGDGSVPSLALVPGIGASAAFEVDRYSGFHCYVSSAACQASPLNTCGPASGGSAASGVACQQNFTTPLARAQPSSPAARAARLDARRPLASQAGAPANVSVYSPCSYTTDPLFTWYCPDGSDVMYEVDPRSSSICYTSVAECNTSPLNPCAPGADSCTFAGAVGASCSYTDAAYNFACNALSVPTSSADGDTFMLCFDSQAACHAFPNTGCGAAGGAACVYDSPGGVNGTGACSHTASNATRWYCPDGSGAGTLPSLHLPASGFEVDRFSGFHCYASAAGCAASPLNNCGPSAPGSAASGVACRQNFTLHGVTFDACTVTDAAYSWYCPDGSDAAYEVDPVSSAICYTSVAFCNSSPLNPCSPGPATTCAASKSGACAHVDARFAYSCATAAVPVASAGARARRGAAVAVIALMPLL